MLRQKSIECNLNIVLLYLSELLDPILLAT